MPGFVADASAYLEFLLDESPDPASRNLDDEIAAPELLFAEIASGLARAVRQGAIPEEHAAFLLEDAIRRPQARDGPRHVAHGERVVEVVERRLEEAARGGGVAEAAVHENSGGWGGNAESG